MNDTYIKLYRKITDWEWYTDVNTCKLFIHILLRASATGRRFRGEEVPIGSFTTSIEILASETGLTTRQVRTALDKLKKTGEITAKTTNKFTQILVIKWGDYQSFVEVNDKQVTNERQTDDKQMTTIKESKESKESKEYIITAPSYESSNAVAKLATNKTNDFYYLHQEDLEKYKSDYPAVDVEQEIRNITAWLDGNPKKRKTHNGMSRFINGWLAKEQNKSKAYGERPKEKKGVDFFYE